MSILSQEVLVIGGAGYIGSHIVLELCENGYDVTVFDNLSTGHKKNIDSRAEFIRGDILNQNDLSNIFQKDYCAVFHFAALKAVGESMMDPGKYAAANICGTINILNQMVDNKIQNFVFSSTAAVYGMPEYLPLDESHPLKPINFYGFTKLEIERLLQWYSDLKGICFVALRYFNAAGYDTKGRIQGLEKNPANLLPIVMETASGIRDAMDVYGNDYNTPDGTGIRDYIHVNDLATAHVKILNALVEKKENIIINLATGAGYSVLEVIQIAKEVTGKEINYNIVERRPGDPAELIAVSRLSQDMIGWKCEYSDMKTILQSMWRIYTRQ
jgi:UDP-glucose 4-epimerase